MGNIFVFVCYSHHILQRGEGPIKILSGPAMVRQRNAIGLAFRWRTDDGVIFQGSDHLSPPHLDPRMQWNDLCSVVVTSPIIFIRHLIKRYGVCKITFLQCFKRDDILNIINSNHERILHEKIILNRVSFTNQ